MKDRPVKRSYDATRRQAQGRQLRLEIVATARDHFVANGFAATTIADVARSAGVSPQLIFKSFGTKAALLQKVVDWTLVGDDAAVPMSARPSRTAVLDEPTAAGKCALFARHTRLVTERVVGTVQMLRAAAQVDPDARSLYETGESHRRTDCEAFVTDVATAGQLRAGMATAQAADAVWALAPDVLWTLLVIRSGWTPNAFEEHLAGLTAAAILEDRLLPAVRRFSRRLSR